MSDRFEEIKLSSWHKKEDFDWLFSEVERLRGVLKQSHGETLSEMRENVGLSCSIQELVSRNSLLSIQLDSARSDNNKLREAAEEFAGNFYLDRFGELCVESGAWVSPHLTELKKALSALAPQEDDNE